MSAEAIGLLVLTALCGLSLAGAGILSWRGGYLAGRAEGFALGHGQGWREAHERLAAALGVGEAELDLALLERELAAGNWPRMGTDPAVAGRMGEGDGEDAATGGEHEHEQEYEDEERARCADDVAACGQACLRHAGAKVTKGKAGRARNGAAVATGGGKRR
jgi:hypothetical protein